MPAQYHFPIKTSIWIHPSPVHNQQSRGHATQLDSKSKTRNAFQGFNFIKQLIHQVAIQQDCYLKTGKYAERVGGGAPSTSPPSSSTSPLRCWSWPATLRATTRRTGSCRATSSLPCTTTRSSASCWGPSPSPQEGCCSTSTGCCCPRRPAARARPTSAPPPRSSSRRGWPPSLRPDPPLIGAAAAAAASSWFTSSGSSSRYLAYRLG
ncbi:hypothetical protein PVAP13_3NG176300 [Panicum virgatum]|uniref:Uncharacterized protein n=1 Tax=Panicum virgatum TaxID=38727 RepID=A0A8T0UAU3_PANVG|nr:hypothetical protein PVAP13_3NG176300 [Panicum virgatum]